MQIVLTIVHVVQLLAAVAMIGLVLIQHGKGADMGASFGSGASGSLFGATGSANFLSRSTAACASLFFACTLALAFMSTNARVNAGADQPTILEQSAIGAAPAASAASGVGGIPGSDAAGSAPAAATPSVDPAASGAAAIPTR